MFQLLINLLYQHLAYQRGERRRYFDVFLGADSIRRNELVLLGKVLDSILRLNVLQLWVVHACQLIDLVDAEDDGDGGSCRCHYIIHFLLPVGSVLNRLHAGDVAHHDDSIGFTTKIPIQTVVTSVHADEIPDV